MFSKLSVRNIPDQIFRALEGLASRHDRSTEAEARQAIRAWVGPALVQEDRNTRRKQVAERLNQMLKQINAGRRGPAITASHIAEAIHEERAEDVEDWFLGEKEPTFSQLAAVAKFLGVAPAWLKHGDDRLFPVKDVRLSEDPFEAVDWLLSWSPSPSGADGSLKTLHLVRADSKDGELYIVKESSDRHFMTFTTPIHVSEVIGDGGERSLAALFVTLELLYKRHTSVTGTVFGHVLSSDDVAQLVSGKTNPATLLTENSRSMWWEDIWDGSMREKREYWPGWTSLYRRIEGVIAERKHLNGQRLQIRRGARTPTEHVAA